MSWEKVNDKFRKSVDKQFVSCAEEQETYYLVRHIREEYPWISETFIKESIRGCFLCIEPPIPKDKFMLHLKARLGV